MEARSLAPTEEQEHILKLARDCNDNLMVNALAGTGKSSTLEMIERVVDTKPILLLCFNKKIAEDATKRMLSTTTVRTFNSLGHRIWAKSCSKNLTLDSKKSQTILRSLIDEIPRKDQGPIWDSFWEIVQGVALAKALGYVPEGKFLGTKRLVDTRTFIAALDETPDDLTADLIDAVLTRSIQQAYEGRIDYNDQVYMPALFGGTFPRFPLVKVDEVQDLNPVNHALLGRLVKNRLIAVGDPYQCHPPGTMIKVTGLGDIKIERLTETIEVATYSTRASRFAGIAAQGCKVEKIVQQHFSGNLVIATVNGYTVKMTPNHKCVVRINRNARGHLLYLMRRGDSFRIGTCAIKFAGNAFGPSMRARQEKADAIWVLDVFQHSEEAYIAEQVHSLHFGIPTWLFESDFQQDRCDKMWEEYGPNIEEGNTCLKFFNRDIEHPIWKNNDANFVGFHRAGTIHACNLIPDLMTMLTYPDGTWHSVKIDYEAYTGYVYGLTVEPTEGGKRTYLANNILTHNSIYGFRGAMQSGMAALATKFKTTPTDLSVSFRCPQAIVENARWRVPNFKWIKEGGRVEHLKELQVNSIPDSGTVLCRNNAPLFKLALNFLSSGRSVSVAGSDIGPKLIGLLRKLGPAELPRSSVLSAIEDWKDERLAKDSTTAEDMAACMVVFAEAGSTLGQAIAYAEHVLAQKGTIRLMTGHKAKGLEFETVYFLDPWLCRDDEQDLNLKYVIETRSLQNLFYINSRDIRWN